jgi:hypothetical protein
LQSRSRTDRFCPVPHLLGAIGSREQQQHPLFLVGFPSGRGRPSAVRYSTTRLDCVALSVCVWESGLLYIGLAGGRASERLERAIKEECVVEKRQARCVRRCRGCSRFGVSAPHKRIRPLFRGSWSVQQSCALPSARWCASECGVGRTSSSECIICGVAPFRFHSLCRLQNRERFGQRHPAAAAS